MLVLRRGSTLPPAPDSGGNVTSVIARKAALFAAFEQSYADPAPAKAQVDHAMTNPDRFAPRAAKEERRAAADMAARLASQTSTLGDAPKGAIKAAAPRETAMRHRARIGVPALDPKAEALLERLRQADDQGPKAFTAAHAAATRREPKALQQIVDAGAALDRSLARSHARTRQRDHGLDL